MFQDSLDYSRKQLDELRDLGVASFTLAVVPYPAPDDHFPLHYPSSTVYRAERTYTDFDLRKVFQLQQSVSVLVVEHIWDVVPDNMDSGDALLVRVRVDLGADWESTKIVGYAGAIQIMYGRHNEPFILKLTWNGGAAGTGYAGAGGEPFQDGHRCFHAAGLPDHPRHFSAACSRSPLHETR
ncbi:MAG: hypothetical protein HQ464_13535 [Planctomycetes bacterium]|nr:hypothetical protein [Planctomycetota bacterium]